MFAKHRSHSSMFAKHRSHSSMFAKHRSRSSMFAKHRSRSSMFAKNRSRSSTFAKHRSRHCYSRCLLNIDHSVVNVCQTSTIQCSQCLLTIERLVDVYETFVLLLSIDKEAMFSKHWLFVEDQCFWWVETIIIPLIFSKHLLFATRLLKYAFWDKRHPILLSHNPPVGLISITIPTHHISFYTCASQMSTNTISPEWLQLIMSITTLVYPDPTKLDDLPCWALIFHCLSPTNCSNYGERVEQ